MKITKQEVLALEAVTYGCNTNKKCALGTFVKDIHNYKEENTIEFEDAIQIVWNLIDRIEEENNENNQ